MDTLCSRMLLVLALTPLLALATPTPPTHDFMLDNGLKVIVREDHRAPLVTTQLWFKVGSSDESPATPACPMPWNTCFTKAAASCVQERPRPFLNHWALRKMPSPASM